VGHVGGGELGGSQALGAEALQVVAVGGAFRKIFHELPETREDVLRGGGGSSKDGVGGEDRR